MNKSEVIRTIESLRKIHSQKERKCLYKNCENQTLKYSHIFQKNGILNNISHNNHILQFNKDAFNIEKNGSSFLLKEIGINKAFSFPGFCSYHDNLVFESIEKTKINFENRVTQTLFAYRSICNEIYRKEVMKDVYNGLSTSHNVSPQISFFSKNQLSNEIYGIKNLTFFKKELEEELENNTHRFQFDCVKFDKTEICISAPLNIYDENNPKSFEDKKTMQNYVTSVINIFPYNNSSYLLSAQHLDFNCNWTEKFVNDFSKNSPDNKLKLISDFITTRAEMWCISHNLHNEIGKDKFNDLYKIWKENLNNYDFEIKTNFNLFDKNK